MEKILWITNLITLVLLMLLGWHYEIPQKVYRRLFVKVEQAPAIIRIEKDSTEIKCAYALKFYDFHYKKETDTPAIIMLGDSHIRNGDWTHLLNRTDVINRGISGDFTECMCLRLKYLEGKNAKIWFINGGINDLPWKEPEFVLDNYKKIIEFVKNEKAIPVINLLLYTSPLAAINYPTRADYKKINSMVKTTNTLLVNFAKQNNIDYIDLNKITADENDVFKAAYTTDGIHLTENVYKEWASMIQEVLVKHKI